MYVTDQYCRKPEQVIVADTELENLIKKGEVNPYKQIYVKYVSLYQENGYSWLILSLKNLNKEQEYNMQV